MNELSMTNEELEYAKEIEKALSSMEQFDVETFHTLHAGVYTRTIILEPGQVASGVVISIPTTLIITGHVKLLIGDQVNEIEGFNVFTANANRKQIALAVKRSVIAMVFKTDARTIEEAEAEFTTEPEKLASRLPTALNRFKQGALLCQE